MPPQRVIVKVDVIPAPTTTSARRLGVMHRGKACPRHRCLHSGRVVPLMVLAALLGLFSVVSAADDWKFDVLRLKNGAVFRGLLIEETDAEVRFRNVRRSPGQPTV